jgi:hypothetical protein
MADSQGLRIDTPVPLNESPCSHPARFPQAIDDVANLAPSSEAAYLDPKGGGLLIRTWPLFPKEARMAVKTLDKPMIDAALLDPSVVFDCPADVVSARGASDAEKVRILHRWEYDIREEEVAQEENMPGELPVRLSQVLDALTALGAGPDHRHPSPAKQ